MSGFRIRQVLAQCADRLATAGIDEYQLDAEVLIVHCLGMGRAELWARMDEVISTEAKEKAEALILRRQSHEPVAHLTGHKEFYGFDFLVTPDTLIPRPETELLVELALRMAAHAMPAVRTVADIGTGCGCIAISLALNMPAVTVMATDISTPALAVAATNARNHGVAERVHLLKGNLMEPLGGEVDMIVANLPYVSESEMACLPADVRLHEPEVALDGGPDGLRLVRALLSQAVARMPRYLLLEIGSGQGDSVAALVESTLADVSVSVERDLAGNDRVVVVKRGRD